MFAALLGEMHKLAGSATTRGRLGYAPQHRMYAISPWEGPRASLCVSAWIMNASVRENILFGHRYDEDFYNGMADLLFQRAAHFQRSMSFFFQKQSKRVP
jgi:hypothetical protein